MKLKFLLFLMFVGSILHAQEDTIRSLIITEAQFKDPSRALLEITNMGTEAVQLNQFQIGQSNWADFRHDSDDAMMLPERMLQPGESFFVAVFRDWNPEAYQLGIEGYSEYSHPLEYNELADLQIHLQETNRGDDYDPRDSVSLANPISMYFGRNAMFIEQHFPNGDSVVVDQVMGVFDNADGDVAKNRSITELGDFFDVAGFEDASMYGRLIRKYIVKKGNLNFADARGIGIDDSEWLVVPIITEDRRALPWTLNNHGDYNLTENTLEPTLDDIEVDYAGKTITVPWGIRKPDGIMENMKKKPGVMWYYHLSPNHEDSLTYAVATGDKLEVLVAGNDLDRATFDIIVREPDADNNRIIPMLNEVEDADYGEDIERTIPYSWPWITETESGLDTITGSGPVYNTGIPFATRIDTLLERLDIADNATMEIILQGENDRADVQDGDIIRVTAENGDIKDYYIKVKNFVPNDDATLSAITWPDIPDFYRGIFGWIGDTIPNFTSNVTTYRVQVPLDADGIPALVAKPSDLNAKVDVERATNLSGTLEDRTTTFTVVAEDDTTIRTYRVQLEKEKHPDNIQPYTPEPFISEFVHTEQFGNYFMEIVNPGNQPLDLSNYMIARGWGSAADIIQSMSTPGSWRNRYRKYVPGYKWVNESEWQVSPAILEQDLNVNSMVQPGDVFAMGHIVQDQFVNPDRWPWVQPQKWWIPEQLDIQFNNKQGTIQDYNNPWGENVGDSPMFGYTANIYLFKILNDSVKRGLKPANDPTDFEIVDAFGMADQSDWNNAGMSAGHHRRWIRKPEIKEGNPVMQASFGTNKDDSEWIPKNTNDWAKEGIGWPMNWTYASIDIGKHFMNTPTEYMSTVSSVVYKVSPGYTMNERIWGMTTGTTVEEFLGNIIQADSAQTLTITSNGTELAMADELTNNDKLTVMSADSTNTSQYVLEISAEGLSSDAVLTSDRYDIIIEEEPKSGSEEHEAGFGTISGFEYGTQLKTILANVTVPEGAVLSIVNREGAYVPLQRLNYDTIYVDVTVNNDTYFEVIAEDGLTTILYQLEPEASPDFAFVTSDLFTVTQSENLIENIPAAITVPSFLNSLIPATGATMEVVDKTGYVRKEGTLYRDDELVVTSASGEVQRIYFIAFLPTDTMSATIHLAYLQSNYYGVDQINNVVKGPRRDTEVDQFLSRVTAAPGASIVLMDAEGNEKISGTLAVGDMVKVVAADGKTEVMYSIDIQTSSKFVDSANINLYPNPTSGKVNISGLEAGGKIQVFNATGAVISEVEVKQNIETISLSNQPSGMYFIVVSDANKMLGRYKVIKN